VAFPVWGVIMLIQAFRALAVSATGHLSDVHLSPPGRFAFVGVSLFYIAVAVGGWKSFTFYSKKKKLAQE